MNLSDKSLIALVLLNNDHRAYEKIVIKYQSSVRGLFIKLTNGNKALSDDLAQDTFIRAYKYLRSFKAAASFSTWLYRISYNVFIDHTKSLKRTDNIDGYDCISNDDKDVGSEIDMQNAIKVLNDNEKVAILLHYDNGYSHNEIAKIMDIPLGTVKTNILRAKEKLKKYYKYDQNR
jgi:RNA polymerase sigma-70 factor (ECF subfamily)